MLAFTSQQINKISDLFMDLGKGLLIAGFGAPLISAIDFLILLKLFSSGIICVFFSLKLLERGDR